jgi:hypothetical protein
MPSSRRCSAQPTHRPPKARIGTPSKVASCPISRNWAAPGLAAAALLFAAAGALLSRQNDEDLTNGYEAVTESVATDVLPGAVQVVSAPRDGSSQREATFRYVMSH